MRISDWSSDVCSSDLPRVPACRPIEGPALGYRDAVLMARRRQHALLLVYLNNRLVGHLAKEPSGAISFRYDDIWLGWEQAFPVSLSLPLREDPYRGEPVAAVFENLLPDSEPLRRRVAEKVGARGIEAYSLLAANGRDCVGALQFIADGTDERIDSTTTEGEHVDNADNRKMLST